jgi:hypothetical protein
VRKTGGRTPKKEQDRQAEVSKPLIRCWQDDTRYGNLHISANAPGLHLLLQTLDEISLRPHPAEASLRLDETPLVNTPTTPYPPPRVFSELRLVLIEESDQVRWMYAHLLSDRVCEIQLAPRFIGEFRQRCSQMNGKSWDSGIAPPGEPMHQSAWKKLKTRDKESLTLMLWGSWAY